EAGDVTQFRNQAGRPDRAQPRHTRQCLRDGGQFLGNRLIYSLELLLQGAYRGHGRTQHQPQWFLQHLVQAVGVAGRALQGDGQFGGVAKAPVSFVLQIGRQIVERVLSQLLGGELFQHRATGGAKGVTEGRELPIGGEGQKQKAQEVVL